DKLGKFFFQRLNNFTGIVDAECSLCQRNDFVRIRNAYFASFIDIGDDADPIGRLAASSNNLVMRLVTDKNYPVSRGRELTHLPQNFFNQRGGHIEWKVELVVSRLLPNRRRNPVGAKN